MVETIQKTFRLYPQQKQFVDSRARFRGFCAGIGAGKSKIGAYDLIRRSKPGRLYMVVAPTYDLMAAASFRSMLEVASDLDLVDPAKVNRGKPPSMFLRNGAEILFRSGDEPEYLRGPNLSGCWLDETSLMHRSVFDVMIGRLREAGELGWLTATFTPKGRAHWTFEQFATGREDTFLVRARTGDNPFLPADFEKSTARQYTQRQREQELGGEFLADAGNHFMPGLWPRYTQHAENAWSVVLGNHARRTYPMKDCTVICAFDWALNKVNRTKLKRMKESLEENTDFCSIGAAALTPDGNLLMLDRICERIRMEGKAPTLAAFCRRWRPAIVAGDEDMIAEGMQLDCRRYRDIPEIRLLPFRGKGKVERATPAIIRGENGLIYLPQKRADSREEEWVEGFCNNLSTFTGIDDEHDDDVDMLGIIGRVADDLKGDGRELDQMPEMLAPARDLYGPSWAGAAQRQGDPFAGWGDEPPPTMMSSFGRR